MNNTVTIKNEKLVEKSPLIIKRTFNESILTKYDARKNPCSFENLIYTLKSLVEEPRK